MQLPQIFGIVTRSSKVLMSTSGPIKASVTLACQRGHTTKQRRQDIFIKDRNASTAQIPYSIKFYYCGSNNPRQESGCRSLSVDKITSHNAYREANTITE